MKRLTKAELLALKREAKRVWGPVIAPLKKAVAESERITAKDRAIIVRCVLLILALCSSAEAATYYVAPTGSDVRTCVQSQTIGTPKATVNSGIGCLKAGDTLLVRGGTYDEAVNYSGASGTDWTNAVRIAAYQNEVVWLKPSNPAAGYAWRFGSLSTAYVELDGINIDASAQPYAIMTIDYSGGQIPHHLRWQNAEGIGNRNQDSFGVITQSNIPSPSAFLEFINLKIHGGGRTDFHHGFYLEVSDLLIQNCEVYDWPGAGIQINVAFPGAGSPTRVVLRGNRIHDLRSTSVGQRHWGIIVGGAASASLVANNTIWNIPSNGASTAGIDVYRGVGTNIYNNTIYAVGGAGIQLDTDATGTTVRNNIVFNTPSPFVNGGSGTIEDHDLLGTDPLFVNPGSGNFQEWPWLPCP